MYPVATMYRLLGVSTSGYYAWQGRAPSARTESDEALLDRIREIHRLSRGSYGAPRIHAELVDRGYAVGPKRVARLMRRAGLRGISRRKGTRTTTRDARARAAACAPPPDRSGIATTTPCARASSPPSNGSCSTAAGSALMPKPEWPSSSSLRVGTIRDGATPPSDICQQSTTNGANYPPLAQIHDHPRNRGNSTLLQDRRVLELSLAQ